MKKIMLIIISLILLSGCSSQSNEKKGINDIKNIEIVRFGYKGTVSIENQIVHKTASIDEKEGIIQMVDALSKKVEPKVKYNVLAPLGRIIINYEGNTEESYDVWIEENLCLIYDNQTKKYYNITDTEMKYLNAVFEKLK